MGRVGNVSSDLRGAAGRGGVGAPRIPKEGRADEPKRHRTGAGAIQRAAARKSKVEEPLVIEEFESVWVALGFPPREAANLEARSTLMIQIELILKEQGWTQAEAAKRCGVSQPRINDLLRGKIDKFSIDALVNMAGALGRRVKVELEAA